LNCPDVFDRRYVSIGLIIFF